MGLRTICQWTIGHKTIGHGGPLVIGRLVTWTI